MTCFWWGFGGVLAGILILGSLAALLGWPDTHPGCNGLGDGRRRR